MNPAEILITFYVFDLLDRSTSWRFSWCVATCSGTSIAAHLVWTCRVQRSNGGRTTFTSACVRSEQSTDSHIPRRHMHQQHIGDAIQERQLRGWRCHLSGGYQVSTSTPMSFKQNAGRVPAVHWPSFVQNFIRYGYTSRCSTRPFGPPVSWHPDDQRRMRALSALISLSCFVKQL